MQKSAVESAKDDVRDMADKATEQMKAAEESAQEMADKAREYGEKAQEAVKEFKPLVEKSLRDQPMARVDGKFSKADFTFDRERNVYICPAGKELTHSGVIDQGRILPYRSSTRDCMRCDLKPRCTTATTRKVSRDIDEDVRDYVRSLEGTEAFAQSCVERKKVEMRFAHMKRIHKLDRLRLRGLTGAKDEVLLTALAQNLKRLAKFVWQSAQPGPMPA
jgi:hypothetical protein